MPKQYPACAHCDGGRKIPGKYGTVCNICQTYEPAGEADAVAEIYMQAVNNGQPTDALLKQLTAYFIDTLETLQTGATDD